MRKTTNYALNQWDDTDRILREDFNRDNEKIDAGLQGLKSAQSSLQSQITSQSSSLQSQISNHSSFQLLRTVTTSYEANRVDLNISNVNWGSYQTVILELINSSAGYGDGTLRLNNSGRCHSVNQSFNSYAGIAPINFGGINLVYLPVFYHPERVSSAFTMGSTLGYGYNGPAYQDITTINLVGDLDRYYAGKGTVINIWGVK